MSTAGPKKRLLDAPYEDFINDLLPLYTDPYVRIRIGSASREYKLSKAVLCRQSVYFAATFEGGFQEGEEHSTTLTEIDGVVSTRSFELLVQWLYIGRVIFGELAPAEAITATIEFVRIADICQVTEMESLMAECIKAIIIANPGPNTTTRPGPSESNNTYCLTSEHITSAADLPDGHLVRRILAAAAVEGYLLYENHKFLKEMEEVHSFSVDLLKAVKATLETLSTSYSGRSVFFKDPLRGVTVLLREC
ncbi:uncharacterized protein PAC_08714 [Phialocephala subalpina]|uniref:BTB domain-containing protein n=1 Tax=Phialocephala subalpina TaxID=576137 RepID=A0A1L7X1C8_9HELO|nr:uncharacterized protein PAC_08714 [Phialocephala subalpina]